MTLTIELPDEVYETLRRSPAEVQKEMRLAAAIRWYSQGLMSQERTAMVAGLDRTDFLMALAREKREGGCIPSGSRSARAGNLA